VAELGFGERRKKDYGKLAAEPKSVCRKCGRVAADARNLCNPHKL
jgi:hypothetical protein